MVCEQVENDEDEDGMERVSSTCHAPEPIWQAISTFLLLPPERYLNSIDARLSIAGVIIYAPAVLNLMAMTLLDLLDCAPPPKVQVPEGKSTLVSVDHEPEVNELKSSDKSACANPDSRHAATSNNTFLISDNFAVLPPNNGNSTAKLHLFSDISKLPPIFQ